MRLAGVILIALGLLGLVITGITIVTTEQVADFGPLTIEREEQELVPFPTWLALLVLIVGIIFTALGGRGTSTSV